MIVVLGRGELCGQFPTPTLVSSEPFEGQEAPRKLSLISTRKAIYVIGLAWLVLRTPCRQMADKHVDLCP
ncbi:hypothetical protein [Paraburkholderia dinghuensis]|uniref:Uncharacterized protein n=1 Tax=Paraburkholderia dinghuensis TaxID=2305225 RepID=A0A3N6PPK3_9BURK|nr:hypothetical protein [Paraburkholderia dinghuensis]RQH01116.1 hypothetical protein D1Y85_23710 [Paraburkholderia dinghuensis]